MTRDSAIKVNLSLGVEVFWESEVTRMRLRPFLNHFRSFNLSRRFAELPAVNYCSPWKELVFISDGGVKGMAHNGACAYPC